MLFIKKKEFLVERKNSGEIEKTRINQVFDLIAMFESRQVYGELIWHISPCCSRFQEIEYMC